MPDPNEETDNLILTWVLQEYDQNRTVSYTEVQQYAQNTLPSVKLNFKASIGWVKRFFKRHHILLLNQDDFYEGDLPAQLEIEIKNFIQNFQRTILPKYASRVGCMDEISISFSEFHTSTHGQACSRPRVKKHTVTNCDVTVILTLMADGTLVHPFIIVKVKRWSNIHTWFVNLIDIKCSFLVPKLLRYEQSVFAKRKLCDNLPRRKH